MPNPKFSADELRKRRWGPAEGYDGRMRDELRKTPFDAIAWDELRLEDVREILRILGARAQGGRYGLVKAARRALWAFQRSEVDPIKIAALPGPAVSSAVAIAQKKRAWR